MQNTHTVYSCLSVCSRGEVKSECWLVLTESSLQCYDRHPFGVTRKPLNSFCWTDPQNLVVVLNNVDSRSIFYMSPAKHQHLLFAIEQHSMSGVQRAVFIAASLEEKEDWVTAIESAITRNSGVIGEGSNKKSPIKSGAMVTPVRSSPRLAARPVSMACTTSSPNSSII